MARQATRQVADFDLRTERLNRGFSQAQLAADIGVTERVVVLAESGSVPRPENALKIASYFNRAVTELWPVPEQAA